MSTCRRVALASLVALVALPTVAQARKPVVAYVDDGKRMRLYDTELRKEQTAPGLTISDRIRGFGVSSNGRFVAYRDAGNVTHLYDNNRGTDTALPGAQGTPRSVSNAGVIASDGNDNGPTHLYDGVAQKAVPSGLDDANGDNKHRQSRISGNGRLLATTCLAGCLKDTGGDSDLFVQDLGALTDTAFPDDISGQAGRDEEHPCISADGRFVGADTAVGNQHDVFVYDRQVKRTLSLAGINRPNADDVYCSLDASAQYVALEDNVTGDARLYTRAGTEVPLPDAITGPVWLVQYPRDPRVLTRIVASPKAFRPVGRHGAGTRLSLTLSRGGYVRIRIKRGTHVLRSYRRAVGRGLTRLRIDGRVRRGRRLVPLRAGRYTLQVKAVSGRARDLRSVSVRVRA